MEILQCQLADSHATALLRAVEGMFEGTATDLKSLVSSDVADSTFSVMNSGSGMHRFLATVSVVTVLTCGTAASSLIQVRTCVQPDRQRHRHRSQNPVARSTLNCDVSVLHTHVLPERMTHKVLPHKRLLLLLPQQPRCPSPPYIRSSSSTIAHSHLHASLPCRTSTGSTAH